MKLNVSALLIVSALAMFATPCVGEEAQPKPAPIEGSVPITQLIADVAKRTKKTFLVDPRVRGDVALLGPDSNNVGYEDLLSVLQIHGFVAVDDGRYIRIVPDANARQLPTPLLSGAEKRPGAEYVVKLLAVKSVPAPQLVPLLRPLLPQHAHLVAFPCTNVLVVADTFANIQRIEKLVRVLDTASEPYQPSKCGEQAVAKAGP
jgi:type II secretory pathway component GspD/PulD (secretin)